MSQSVSITRQFQGSDINIVIPLEMKKFTDLMSNSIAELVTATKVNDSIPFKLNVPSDLEYIFARSQEEPDILVLFGPFKRSTKLLFGAIPDHVKAAAIAASPIGYEPVDRTVAVLSRSFANYPDSVKVSIAILTVLFYIEQVNQILMNEINVVVDMIQKGANPVIHVSQIPDVTLVDWTGGKFTFTVSKTFDTRMANSPTYMVDNEFLRYVNSLPSEVKESLVDYTDCHYRSINTYFRKDVKTKCSSFGLKHIITHIDAAFQGAPPISEPMILYRGQEKDIFDTKSYTSASSLLKSASNFFSARDECCIYEITVTPGSKVLPLAGISIVPSEAEILLDRGGKFVITRKEKKTIQYKQRSIQMNFIYLTYMTGEARKLDEVQPS